VHPDQIQIQIQINNYFPAPDPELIVCIPADFVFECGFGQHKRILYLGSKFYFKILLFTIDGA